ncbi:MAG: hypothetical protein NTY07_14380 [Bacteroidia bacterium]|nr:hypothetical protein [Bacteroidia bacterium]
MAFSQEIGDPIIRNYPQKEYNNAPVIFSAIQDNRGIMYFAVEGGVMEFDGINWRNIPFGKETYTYDLAMDKNGKIYVGAIDEFGYLETDKKGNTNYKSLTHLKSDTTLKIGTVWSVKLTSRYVYFQTLDAIYQYSPVDNKIKIFRPDTNGKFIGDFVFKDTYYIRQIAKGLMKILAGLIQL